MIKKFYEGVDSSRLYFRNALFVLRPIREYDMQSMFDWRRDPLINQYLTSPSPATMEDQMRWYQKYQDDPGSLFFMVLKRNHEDIKIGQCSLFKIDENAENAEFGVVVGNQKFFGGGSGVKLTVMIFKIVFSFLGFRAIFGNVHPENRISCKIHGFIGSELIRQQHEYGKDDEILYKVDRAIFEAFEKKILSRSEKWKDVLDIERMENRTEERNAG